MGHFLQSLIINLLFVTQFLEDFKSEVRSVGNDAVGADFEKSAHLIRVIDGPIMHRLVEAVCVLNKAFRA